MTSLTDDAFRHLNDWITRRMELDGTPGLSLAVTDRDGLIHVAAFGMANVEAGVTLTPTHLLEPGSIGKTFTAVALLQLADEGRIDVQTPVTDYLPWFEVESEHGPIRLHHLLMHTAGITAGFDFAPASGIQVWALRDTVASAAPGTFVHYSNVGYKVLGEVLRAVTGETYGETIQKRILDSLGLADSTPTITAAERPRLAVGYSPISDDLPWWAGRPLWPATWVETDTADGCQAMTAADLAVVLRMLLNRGEHEGRQVLSKAAFELMTQRDIEMYDDLWYGYGVMTSEVDGRAWIGHGGGMVGYSAAMLGDVEGGIGAVALVNGPSSSLFTIARTAVRFVLALRSGETFELPELEEPGVVAGGEDFAGEWMAVEGLAGPPSIRIGAGDQGLTVETAEISGRLNAWDEDAVATEFAPLDRFPLRFQRNDEDAVVRATYGDTVYLRAGEAAPEAPTYPEEWAGFVGLYRSHNPWNASLRVVRREGRLWLLMLAEPDGLEAEQPLVPLEDGWFRAGEDPRIPERIRFDAEIDGVTHRASLSGCDFYRVDTP